MNTDDAMEALKPCTKCHFNAPTAMLICYNREECWTRKYDGAQSGIVDASIVATHVMLEAAELGVGVTWVMWENEKSRCGAAALRVMVLRFGLSQTRFRLEPIPIWMA